MTTSFKVTRRFAAGMIAAALAVVISAQAEARQLGGGQPGRHYDSGGRGYGGHRDYGAHRDYGGHRHYRSYGSHSGHGSHGYWRGGPYVDGAWLLGAFGLGLAVDAIVASQRPVVVYQPQPAYQYQQAAAPYPQQHGPDYPPPRRDYPECREFIGNPGALAFCEKGVLERENEEQRLLEQKAYETGRGR